MYEYTSFFYKKIDVLTYFSKQDFPATFQLRYNLQSKLYKLGCASRFCYSLYALQNTNYQLQKLYAKTSYKASLCKPKRSYTICRANCKAFCLPSAYPLHTKTSFWYLCTKLIQFALQIVTHLGKAKLLHLAYTICSANCISKVMGIGKHTHSLNSKYNNT